jgi:hypothetical protein
MAMITALLLPTISFEFQGKVWNFRLHSIQDYIPSSCLSMFTAVIIYDKPLRLRVYLVATSPLSLWGVHKLPKQLCAYTQFLAPQMWKKASSILRAQIQSTRLLRAWNLCTPTHVVLIGDLTRHSSVSSLMCMSITSFTSGGCISSKPLPLALWPKEQHLWNHYIRKKQSDFIYDHWPWFPPRFNDGRQLYHIQWLVDITDAVSDVELLPPRSEVWPCVLLTELKTCLHVHLVQ